MYNQIVQLVQLIHVVNVLYPTNYTQVHHIVQLVQLIHIVHVFYTGHYTQVQPDSTTSAAYTNSTCTLPGRLHTGKFTTR